MKMKLNIPVNRSSVCLGLLAVAFSGTAMARCDAWETEIIHPTTDATLTGNGMSNGRPVGNWQPGSAVTSGGCSEGYLARYTLNANLVPVGTYRASASEIYSIYDSGVPGLGVIVGFRSLYAVGGYKAVSTGRPAEDENSSDRGQLAVSEVRVRYIKIGDVAEGTYTTNRLNLGSLRVRDSTSVSYTLPLQIEPAQIEIVHRPVCYPQPKAVKMGSTPLTDFSGQYSGGRKRGFLIEIECDAGVGDVGYYLEGTESSPAVDVGRGIVEVSGGATGVGLQMMENDRAVPLETLRYFGSSSTGGRINRHFYARYVQTAAKLEDIVPGAANAAIRIGMDYP